MQRGYQKERKQSIVLGNFYSLITILIVCTAIVLYINYLKPIQEEKEYLLAQQKKEQEYFELRAKQKELARKLNPQDYNHSDE
ncbi:MAG: hypothetical protein IE909_02385 [Campylobacterales bacterium]|nr:hypothetical protein [Campylobacterales bacterium]